jgi:hypothetical protein
MNIAIDLHGTADVYPLIFNRVFVDLKKQGHQICIISGSPEKKIYNELNKLKLDNGSVDAVFSIVNYLINYSDCDLKRTLSGWWASEDIWYSAKSKICEKYNIDYLIDNEIKYKKYFKDKSKFILFQGIYNNEDKIKKLFNLGLFNNCLDNINVQSVKDELKSEFKND